jgi:hypothetical protein
MTIDAAFVSPGELRQLAETRGATCVSLYMPTHREGPAVQQDPIRLRNLLAEAERRLLAAGMRTPDVQALLAPAGEIVAPHNFWQRQGEALAIFLAPNLFRDYRLPFGAKELLLTGNRFHLKPLLPFLRPDGVFYILALSQNRVRLLQGTRHTVSQVDLSQGVPRSLADALRDDEKEKQTQIYAAMRVMGGPSGEGPVVYMGRGAANEDPKTDILRYFHQIDDGLREWLGPSQAPLVLAGVEYLHPIYHEANSYPHLLATGLQGNPDELRPEELHAKAWDIVRPVIVQVRENAVERFRQLHGAGTGRASIVVEQVAAAAAFGRVDTLFVDIESQSWGRFDAASGSAVTHDVPEAEDEDLLDLSAVQTYLNSGAVYALSRDRMPIAAPVAAIYRY